MKRILIVCFIVVLLLASCAPVGEQPLSSEVTVIKVKSIYTDLGAPEDLNGRVAKMQDGDQVCYLMWGGTGVGISCIDSQKKNTVDSDTVTYTDLGAPEDLNGRVAKMQDGDQVCYLMWGGRGVGINCP